MTVLNCRWLKFMTAVVLGATATTSVTAAPPVDFNRDVLPILSDACFQCHGPDVKKRAAELRLDEEASAKLVRDGTAAIKPGDSAASELFKRITSKDPDLRMPPRKAGRQLTAAEIDVLKRWIDSGAQWSGHWSFQPLNSPTLPMDAQTQTLTSPQGRDAELFAASSHPLDHFVRARLAVEKLKPAPRASLSGLQRRLTLDLTGLPPQPDDVDQSLEEERRLSRDEAYARLVDRLLATPEFGERMAWDWLDAARYADSNGYQGDSERTMWPWRDWVVRTLNDNQPYDEFTVWQLAGDLLPQASLEQQLATGFCRNHMINGEGGRIAEENRVDYVMDMTETVGTLWLGLTFNCARCHDHKFDPISRRDYYSLFAFFNQTPVEGGGGNPQTPPVIEAPTSDQATLLKQWSETIAADAKQLDDFEQTFFSRPAGQSADKAERLKAVPAAVRSAVQPSAANRNRNQLLELEKHFEKESPEYVRHVRKLREAIDNRDNIKKSIVRVMVMSDLPQTRQTFMLEKGLYDKRGEVVTAAVPAKLPALEAGLPSNRLGLARWLTSTQNPLTARVTVNRLWQQFFGIGLVKTSEDFGLQGEPPANRELLDWLAAEFVSSGWDVKHLVRLIVTSETYQQSSRVSAELWERDPANRLLARGPRFRMPSWMLRDQALAASGLLVTTIGGPAVKPYQPTGVWEEATFGNKRYQPDSGTSLYRRSLYTFWRRIIAPTMFFDNASRQVCTVKPFRTNTPLHALLTLNDPTFVEAARYMAEGVLSVPESERLNHVFRRVLARIPTAAERQIWQASWQRLQQQFTTDPAAASKLLAVGQSPRNTQLNPIEHAAWTVVCLGILNQDEALTKE